MKKLAKLAALLAAGALVFGFAACSGDDDDDVAVEGVTLNPTELTVTLGGEPVKLTAIVLPEDADNKEVLWASDNEDAATVDENGVVTAVGAGTATITVTTEDGGYTATCVVTVSDGTVDNGGGGITNPDFPTKTDDTTANDVATLGLVGTSADSSNQSVAKAKVEGGKIVITSHGAGTAVITVKDGDKKATISVTVAADGTITIGTITKYEPMLSGGELSYTLFKLDDLSSGVSLSDGKLSDELTALGITLDGSKLSNDSNKVSAADNSSTSAFNGTELSLANYVGTQGSINGSNYLKIVATADMTVYVYARSGSSEERSLALYSATSSNNGFDEDTKQGIGSNEGDILGVAKFEITKGETKYIGSTGSGINIYAIGVVTGGKPDEETAQTVSATSATCTESGIKAHTVTNFGRYLCGGSYVPYSGVIAPALGHDYTGVTPVKVTDPTADMTGKYTATCARACGHVQEIVLPKLTDNSYDRENGSNNKTSYTYYDETTKLTIIFEADTVESDPVEYQDWELDFTNEPLKPSSSNASLNDNDVIGGVLTVVTSSGSNRNSGGYLKANTDSVFSFKVEAAATLSITFSNSNKDRSLTVKVGETAVADSDGNKPLPLDAKEHTVKLTKGTCTLTANVGEARISKMSLMYDK